jgi:hypothetical protein
MVFSWIEQMVAMGLQENMESNVQIFLIITKPENIHSKTNLDLIILQKWRVQATPIMARKHLQKNLLR